MAGAGGGRKKRVGRYEVGRTIGQGNFAKVKFAVDSETGTAVAMKVLEKDAILSHRMLHQVPARRTNPNRVPVPHFSLIQSKQLSFPLLLHACPFSSVARRGIVECSEEEAGNSFAPPEYTSIIESNGSDTVLNPTAQSTATCFLFQCLSLPTRFEIDVPILANLHNRGPFLVAVTTPQTQALPMGIGHLV
jgi:serine/threonine protein kinase